ncbi:MAG TPA: hypothetical protein VL285_18930 [Bryobacteraceae bacterium]|nr:hypothetical protein [Bryobacteraceae bacterium]
MQQQAEQQRQERSRAQLEQQQRQQRSRSTQPEQQSRRQIEPQRQYPAQQRTQQQARSWQQQQGWLRNGGWQGRNNWQHNRARHWASDHRTWSQRGGYGGYYIPQDRFRLYFGSHHPFRLRARPVMYMGYPRFEYGGFSFLLVDPWPEYWSDDWYANDDLFIDYDDGYYLLDRRDPQVRLAVSVVL